MKTQKKDVIQIAQERVGILLTQALETIHEKPDLAQRYVQLARKIGMKYKVRIPKQWKLLICRGCKRLMVPGLDCRIRIRERREPHIVITCIKCGCIKRIPIRRHRQIKL